ncbi:hypothetical protein KSW81_004224 [Nannochloris sp. 'desiccata']|nr:hypothetical protein KSW81_004224 [Chlorella desiccata (nom. nud.)]
MFEGWASDLLASYLGQFLEVQREQLRISLWSAWRTGLTMQNVAFRPDAFDHMQLPFKLFHGQIGTLQIHVPWRALRSPVVIDLANVELTLALLTPEDLAPDVSSERAWAVKQAHLAAQELQELAAGVSSESDGKPPAEAKQGGMLWSLVQHAVTMLLRRLHLSVSSVHIRVVDPTTGRSFGFKLGKLHTCLPGETEHASLLLAEDAGVAVHSSTAARGSIQKQIAAEGIQLYWKVGNNISINNTGSSTASSSLSREGGASPLLHLPPPSNKDEIKTLDKDVSEIDWNVLHSTDIIVHVTSKIIGGGGTDPIKVHASAIVHSIPVAIRPCQLKDILGCVDQVHWTSARAKHAHLRPSTPLRDWRAMWRYAVNAVLADLKGPLKAAPWRPPAQIQHDRRQYVLLYRKKLDAERDLEKKTEEAAAVAVASSDRQPLTETPQLQKQQQTSSASVPIRIGLSPLGEKRLLECERLLCVQDILMCRSAAAHSLDGTGTSYTGSTAVRKGGSPSDEGESIAGGGVFWGVAKAASFVGYGASAVTTRPDGGYGHGRSGKSRSPSYTLSKASASALLPRPTASDVRELYEAVDFHPEEEERKKNNEESGSSHGSDLDGVGASPGKKKARREEGAWLELSGNFLLTEATLTLKSNNTGIPLAAICLEGLQTEIRLGSGMTSGEQASQESRDQNTGDIRSGSAPRSSYSVGLTAGVTLTTFYGLDYTSSSSSGARTTTITQEESEPVVFFGRGPSASQQNAATSQSPPSSSDPTSSSIRNMKSTSIPPAVRLRYTASASKLDLLVQPLRLRLHPVLLQTLVQFTPPAVEESYVGSCMAALNALGDTSRAAYKAEKLQQLGPPLDLVAKIVDVEVLLVASTRGDSNDDPSGGGVLLRTGAVVLHSVGQAASFAASKPIFNVLGRLQDVVLNEGSARSELGSAVAAVEQRLVYQHIDFSVAAVQIMTISPSLCTSTTTATSVSAYTPEIEILSNFLLPREHGDQRGTPQRHQAPAVAAPSTPTDLVSILLNPLKVSGTIKSHRLALDFGVPQLLLHLAIDPIKATVQYADVELITDIMATGGSSDEGEDGPISAATPPSPTETVAAAELLAGPVQTAINLSLSSIDIQYADIGGFNSQLSLKKGNLIFQSQAPAVGGGDGGGSQIGTVGVEVVPLTGVGGKKAIEVRLVDAVLDGFDEEPGNFITRNNEKDPTHISVSITESSQLHRTAVSVTNVSLGHTTILRILAMIFGHPSQSSQEPDQDDDKIGDNGSSALDDVATLPPTSPPRPSSPPPPPPTTKTSEIAVDLHSCRLICRYQDPLPGSNISVPGQVQDYFFVLKDMFIIELPRMSLNLPFLFENIVDDGGAVGGSAPVLILEDAELILATTGVPGYYLLPMLRLPSVVVEREIVRIDSFSSSTSSAAVAPSAFCQVLKVNAPCVEEGIHPSHLVIGTLAMQLLQQEFIALLGGSVGLSSVENITRACTPFSFKTGQQRASEPGTPRELLESESSDVFLSPPGLVPPLSPSPAAASNPPATTGAKAAEQAAPATLWRLETTIGLASLSLLGSLLTSTCLKLEWHHLFSAISNIPTVVASSSSTTSTSNSSERNASSDESSSLLASLTTTVAWSQLSVHVMRPKDTGELMESYTPFHGMNGVFSNPQLSLGAGGGVGRTGSGSVLSGAGGGGVRTGFHSLRPDVTPPSQIVPGIASAAGAGMKRLNSFSASIGAAAEGIDHEIAAASGDDAAAANQEEQQHSSPLLDATFVDSPSDALSFTDARSVMLSRFSGSGGGGGSVISRHFSVQDSELYEDAASELLLPDGSINRSPDGRSPRQLKPLLPLDLSSSDFEVDLLVKLVSTTSVSATGTSNVNNVIVTQHAQHTDLALEALNLRVYLHGWQHLVECVQNYEDFQVQAVGRVAEASAGWAQLGTLISGEEVSTSSEEVAAPLLFEEQQNHPAMQLRVQAKQLTIEAVAAAGRHPGEPEEPLETARATRGNGNKSTSSSSRSVPAGQILLQLSAEIHQGPDGARFMVSVPAALLLVGPIHLDALLGDMITDYSRDARSSSLVFGPGDPILGLKNAEITASSESFDFFETFSGGEIPIGVGVTAVGTGAPFRTRRSLDALAVSLQHASVWAGQRNLCSAAALGQHAAHMMAEITALQSALTSQQHHHSHHHHSAGATPLGAANGIIHDGRGTAAADIHSNSDPTATANATAAAAVGAVLYEEHHTAINVEIESMAIALHCERLEDSGSSTSANSSKDGRGDATSRATSFEVSPSPLFEVALSKVSIQSTDRGDGGSSGIAMLQIGLDVFNGSKMAWESVIDPWGACLNFTIPQFSSTSSPRGGIGSSSYNNTPGNVVGGGNPYVSPRGGGVERGFAAAAAASNRAQGSQHLKIEVVSNQNFEATVTAAVTDAAAAAGAILSHIPAIILEPDTLNEHILPDNSIAAAASLPVTFQLNNLTGADVEIWLEAPLPGGIIPARPPIGPPTMCLPPSGRAVLPVLPLYQGIAWRSRRAGKPSLTKGVEFDNSIDGINAGGGEESQNTKTDTDTTTVHTIRQRRTLLYFRFSGQQGPLSGPVFLDKPGAVSYAIHVNNPHEPQVSSLLNAAAEKAAAAAMSSPGSSSSPVSASMSAAHVVAETAERRHGSFTAVLHSGVCISNTTPIDLEVGITQTAGGGGGGGGGEVPSSLGVLCSGESTWLPATRAEMGLLHVRPTASYRPQVAERHPPLSARLLPPLPTRHPLAATTAAAGAAGGVGLSSGVQPSSVSSGPSGVVYRSGAGKSTIPPGSTTQTYSPAGTAYGTAAFTSQYGSSSNADFSSNGGHVFGWSAGLWLSQLINQQGIARAGSVDGDGSGHGGVAATVKQLSCASISSSKSVGDFSHDSLLLLTVGATLQGMSWNVSFAPPFTLHNALPVPVDITIIPKRSTSSTAPAPTSYPLRLHLLPNDRAPMLHLNAAHVESVSVRPEGFEMTSPLPMNEKSQWSPAPLSKPFSASEADLAGAWQFHSLSGDGGKDGSTSGGDDTTSISLAGLLLDNNNSGSTGNAITPALGGEKAHPLWIPFGPETVATVQELPPGRSTVEVSIHHALSVATGSHLVRLSCGMWIYNCIGVPLSIRNASLEDSLLAEAVAHQGGNALDTSEQDLIMLSIDDHVPDSWVPPLDTSPSSSLGGGGGAAAAAAAAPEGVLYYGENPSLAGDFNTDISYRGGTTGASPLSTYRTGGGFTARGPGGTEGRTPRPTSARSSGGLLSARAASMVSVGRTASNADVPGLSEILDTGTGNYGAGGGGGGFAGVRVGGINTGGTTTARSGAGITLSPLNTSRSSVLGYQQVPLSSRARGIADSMDSSPTFERPSAWPSMASGLIHKAAHRLRLQLRSAATKAPPGRTFWSPTVDLDTSGGAVVTSIPSPTPAGAGSVAAAAADGLVPAALRGSYPVVVTSTQVPGADGVLALCVSPQFVLRNALDMPIQYKQQGSIAGEREVPPGGSRAIRWADDSLPPRLCVRVQEAGWIWSGGFQLDVPGDIFVKSRHRDRGITMLLRVDVAISTSGSAQIILSHNPAGFAPYRVENCSIETLHARQKSVREQQDVLRPYCALNYAWDEPTQPHILVLELPGARGLGNFDLDKVGQDSILPLPSTRRGEPDKALRVVVRAEGPTRVLTVIDEKVHVMRPLANASTAAGQAIRTTETAAEFMVKRQEQSLLSISQHRTAPGDLSLTGFPNWEIVVDLNSVGISLVSATHEVAYLRLTGARVTAAADAARHSLGFTVKGIQLDNPSPWVAFPVTLVLPAPVSRLGSSMAAAVEMTPAPALQVLLSLWQRRPAGVLCVEVAQFQMRSVAVYLDQQHLEEVAAVVGTVMQGPGGSNGSGTISTTTTAGAVSGGVPGEGITSPSFVHATRASSSVTAAYQPDTVLGGGGGGDTPENKNTIESCGGASTRVTSSVDLLVTTAPESLATSGRQTPTLGLREDNRGASPAASTQNIEGLGENILQTTTSIAPAATNTTPSLFPTMSRLPLQNLAALQAANATSRVDFSGRSTSARNHNLAAFSSTPAGVATVLAPAAAAMALQGIGNEASSSWHRQKIYMDTLSIAPIEVTLSFLSSPVHHYVAAHPRLAALQRLLSLVDVEDARVWLAGLNLSNPLMDAEALSQALQRHYLRSLVPELYKIVGSASMIGDPVSLLQHLGAGVWTFVSAPAEGLLASARALGPRQFLLGVIRGTQGLLLNVVFAISNATTKAAGAARKAIVVWGLDRQDEPLGAGSFRRRVMFIEGGGLRRGYDDQGEDSLLSAILRGLAGLISEPIRGVEEAGIVGFIRGLQRGALRAVALPLAVVLEMSARFADSVRRAVAGSSNLGWLRPPRHVSPSEALAPYDWSCAMGRWLLTELQTVEAHAAARRREKMAANHHDHHQHNYHHHVHHSSTNGRSSVASNTSGSSGGRHGASGSHDGPYGPYSDRGSAIGGALPSSFSPSASPATGMSTDVETFLLCVPTTTTTTAAPNQKRNACYLVLTSKRVLYVRAKGLMWEPDVQWQGDMCDLELVSHVGGEIAVRFVAKPTSFESGSRTTLAAIICFFFFFFWRRRRRGIGRRKKVR